MGISSGHGAKRPSPLHETAAPRSRDHRRLSRSAVITVTGVLMLWLALRYVIEVKVTVNWRTAAVQQLKPGTSTFCSNTCYKARDGVCDEGRPHRHAAKQQWQQQQQAAQGLPPGVSAVHCDLGTDCKDCGPWIGRQADESWSQPLLPIAFLQSHNISVRSRSTSASSLQPLNFTFAFTDPQLDWDVSKYIQQEGVLEVGISQVFYTVLAQRCGAQGPGGLVADVGANFGWFSIMAAAMGCRVVAWEPVPQFLAFLSYNIARNHLSQRVAVRPTVVAQPAGSKHVVVIPNRGIWGTAGISGANIDTNVPGNQDGLQQVSVISESLDAVLEGEQVDLLKVDVEGYEPSVVASASTLLSSGSISNIVLEYSPGVYERMARWSELWLFPRMLLDLTAAGYTLLHLPDDFTRVWAPGRTVTAAVPRLKQILPENLLYDLWDTDAFSTGYLNLDNAKPFCPAMVELHLDNQGMPERLHPKSFHAMFSHNTNVWASREPEVIKHIIGRPVGLFPLNMSITSSWFPPDNVVLGLGGIPCAEIAEDMVKQIQRSGGSSSSSNSSSSSVSKLSDADINTLMTVLIGRRCRCSHGLPCQKHAAAAEACARAGQTPYVDLT